MLETERLKSPLSSPSRWRPHTDTGVRTDLSSPQGQRSPRASGQQMEGGRKQRVGKVMEGTSWGCHFLLTGSACEERIPMTVSVCVCGCVRKSSLPLIINSKWAQGLRRSRRSTTATHPLPFLFSTRIYGMKSKDGAETPQEFCGCFQHKRFLHQQRIGCTPNETLNRAFLFLYSFPFLENGNSFMGETAFFHKCKPLGRLVFHMVVRSPSLILNESRFGCWIYHLERSKDRACCVPAAVSEGTYSPKHRASSLLGDKWTERSGNFLNSILLRVWVRMMNYIIRTPTLSRSLLLVFWYPRRTSRCPFWVLAVQSRTQKMAPQRPFSLRALSPRFTACGNLSIWSKFC